MLITVNEGDAPPVEHPRVKTVMRVGFLTRADVSEHNQLCDVPARDLVCRGSTPA
jgi:hypothetical protein